jgi:hypothetical protein
MLMDFEVPPNNTVSLKEYLEALRIADQRALELLAKSNSDRIKCINL